MDEEISQRAPFSGGDEEESDASEETDQLEQQSDRLQQPAEIDDELVKDSVIEEKVIEEEKKEENNQEKEEGKANTKDLASSLIFLLRVGESMGLVS